MKTTRTRKTLTLAAARRQAYLVIVAGLAVALVGLVLAIMAGQVAQAVSLAAGVVAVLGSLVVVIVVGRRRARRAAKAELGRLDYWTAQRKIMIYG